MNGEGFVSALDASILDILNGVRGTIGHLDDVVVGRGYNQVSVTRFFHRPLFEIEFGICGLDASDAKSCFECAQAAFHEVRHVSHHIDRMRGIRSKFLDTLTFAYLSREKNNARYTVGYPNNVFELDANAYSIVTAKAFCERFFPNTDFDYIACDVWRERCKSDRTRFVTSWDDLSSAEDISSHMHSRIVEANTCGNLSICSGGDAVWVYMHERASDEFCNMWRDAKSELVRDKLCAASLVGSGFVSPLYPDVDSLDWFIGDFDSLSDVRSHQSVCDRLRPEIRWSSDGDVRQVLCLALKSQLSLSSAVVGYFDHISINRYGLSIEHRHPDWVGVRHESEPFGERVVEMALSGLMDGSLVPSSGEVPELVYAWVRKVSNAKSERLPFLDFDDSLMNDINKVDGFEFGG